MGNVPEPPTLGSLRHEWRPGTDLQPHGRRSGNRPGRSDAGWLVRTREPDSGCIGPPACCGRGWRGARGLEGAQPREESRGDTTRSPGIDCAICWACAPRCRLGLPVAAAAYPAAPRSQLHSGGTARQSSRVVDSSGRSRGPPSGDPHRSGPGARNDTCVWGCSGELDHRACAPGSSFRCRWRRLGVSPPGTHCPSGRSSRIPGRV